MNRHYLALLGLLCISTRAGGQDSAGASSSPRGRIGAMAVGALTTANPAMLGERYTEAYLTQPNLMGDVAWRALRFTGTLNFEGYTLRRGELNAGMYGEGYVDRRHPHTLVHEAMLGVVSPSLRGIGLPGVRLSLAAGKGFTPYGTDDPMMRPFVKYPVNHHHAQIIERGQVLGAVAYGDPVSGRGVALEHALFNGDEPYSPFTAPRWSRVGDSHATRLTVKPIARLELQGSRAFVTSPGIVQGGAFDHTQTSLSLRYDASPGAATGHHAATSGTDHAAHAGHDMGARRPDGLTYAMAEFARTDEGDDAGRAFRFESVLAEAAYDWRGARLAVRAERTERPEGERLLDPFRASVGHIDFQIIGVTRWRIATVHLAAPALSVRALGGTTFVPYVETARAFAEARRRPTVFEPREFYGSATQWAITAGVRVGVGPMRSRMGRYGVLAPAAGY